MLWLMKMRMNIKMCKKKLLSWSERSFFTYIASVANAEHAEGASGAATVSAQSAHSALAGAVAAVVHVEAALAYWAGGLTFGAYGQWLGAHWHCLGVEAYGALAVVGIELAGQRAEAYYQGVVHAQGSSAALVYAVECAYGGCAVVVGELILLLRLGVVYRAEHAGRHRVHGRGERCILMHAIVEHEVTRILRERRIGGAGGKAPL